MNVVDVSRLVILGFEGTTLTPHVKDFIKTYRPGGFIFFKDNIQSLSQCKKLIRGLRSFYDQHLNFIPLLCIDHENKVVNRLPSPITAFPDAPSLGETLNHGSAYAMGQTMGKELKGLGINCNFAPVCDVARDITPPYLKSRCFSSNAETVGWITAQFIKGIQETGVMACAKHFPGLGSADKDPHACVVRSSQPKHEFDRRDWVPFKTAIAADVCAMMTTHVICEALDPDEIATYSPLIVQKYLVQTLGFKGLIISDDIKMGAIQEDMLTACIRAYMAGHHLIINSERRVDQNAVILESLTNYYQNDESLTTHLRWALTKTSQVLNTYCR